ncbi:hypothetical protein GLOTRDRAFT_131238 [Gloeophyllum trabeum ATCC 11539]|uniref:F-box domain-containing protein n=1 Tax=Gloeophyllum trabeum (strain ATCC 11539 / FP-39264 / Madison 617) TaxID=670483 RepID=S7PZS2_GLOTA|nr:uncharacterized protein GLOTRDRAFT_131238 [Gloeophyllum trabeum ATCC 11539]EPQ52953.1 hypothetical protein GLOTRDRAFT_131238 [Gloeophyllum trabeum ATCC 11539]
MHAAMLHQLLDKLTELPLLENLLLRQHREEKVAPISLGNLSMPKLQSISSVMTPLDYVRDVGFSWSQITRISLERVVLHHPSFRALHLCRSLRSLHINIWHSPVQQLQPILLHSLEDLQVSFADEEYVAILPGVMAPVLRELHLAVSPWDFFNAPSVIPPLVTMLKNSGCQLKSLELNCRDIFNDVDRLQDLLKSVPSLEELSIKGHYTGDVRRETRLFFGLLIEMEGQSDRFLVPQLKKLDVSLKRKGLVRSPFDSLLSASLNLRRVLGLRGFPVAVLETASVEMWDDEGKMAWRFSNGSDITKEGANLDAGLEMEDDV